MITQELHKLPNEDRLMQKRFTVSEAARVTGVARTTIQRAIRTGRLPQGADRRIAREDLSSAGFHLLSDSAAVKAHIQQLTNENQQLQEEKSRLIQLLDHQDALLRTHGNADSPVRQIDLPTRPDIQTPYDVNAIPPIGRLPTEEDDRITPSSRQYVLAVQLFPDATDALHEPRQAWLMSAWSSVVLEGLEDEAVSPLRQRPMTIDLPLIAESDEMSFTLNQYRSSEGLPTRVYGWSRFAYPCPDEESG
jgi:excisionase family DNA binding protein